MAMDKMKHTVLTTILLVQILLPPSMAKDESSSEAKLQIVFTERPLGGQEPKEYHLKTLASVLGSEDAAKKALVYSYRHAASGFSAKLTPEQVSKLSKQPGVLEIIPDEPVYLHSGYGELDV